MHTPTHLCIAPGLAGEVPKYAGARLKQLDTCAVGHGLDDNMGVKLLQDSTDIYT